MEIKEFFTQIPVKRWFGNGIHSFCYGQLMPNPALTSFAVSDAYRLFVGRAQLLTSQTRPHIEYLILMDNIIVLD